MHETVWHGTPRERQRLLASVTLNCECIRGPHAAQPRLCSLHQAVCFDQRFLDRLLYARRMRERLLCEEWLVDDATVPSPGSE